MSRSLVNYNPTLSVSENVERCGVSETAIKKFITSINTDRRYDELLRRYNAVEQYIQAHKEAKSS